MLRSITYILVTVIFFHSVALAEISGTVKFEGEVPKMKPLDMGADPACKAKHPNPPLAELLVLGEGNSMANVFVRVKSGIPAGKKFPSPTEPVIIKQEGCVYTPHVVGVMVDQPLKFLNHDGILHNVHALPKENREFNLGMPASMKEADKSFQKEEFMFPVKCDVHPWMGAWAAVMTHPYFDVTEKDGKFTLKGLEPGTYEVEAWHEKLGTQSQTVTIGANETKSVDFVFKRPTS